MSMLVKGISDLGGAIARLKQFHQENLLEFIPGGPPKLVCDGVLKLKGEERLRMITTNHSLPLELARRLQNAFQAYTSNLNEVFGRTFKHHPSPNLAVDPVAITSEGGILTFNRNGKRAFVGGGLVDGNETMEEAAAREGKEESGEGCSFKVSSQPVLFVDSVRCKMPMTYFASAVFTAESEGEPVDNLEASGFEAINPEDIEKREWFMDHKFIAMKTMELAALPAEAGSGIFYTSSLPLSETPYSSTKPYLPPITNAIDISYVEELIARVEGFYFGLMCKVKAEVLDDIDLEAFNRSRNITRHGWEDKASPAIERTDEEKAVYREWDDTKRLWDYMGHLKVTGVKISELFGTFINVGEGGVIETVSVYANGDQVFLSIREGRVVLEHELFTQFRDFPTTVSHHASQMGVSLTENPILIGKYEPDSYMYEEGIRARACQFIAPIPDGVVPKGTLSLTFREAASLPAEAWSTIHDYNMFQNLAAFHEMRSKL